MNVRGYTRGDGTYDLREPGVPEAGVGVVHIFGRINRVLRVMLHTISWASETGESRAL